MESLFPSLYVQGYTAALQDVIKVMDSIQLDLKMHKVRQSHKTYDAIVKCMLENRVELRENPDAFIRHNATSGEFELWYNGKRTKDW